MTKYIPKEATPGFWLKKVMPETPEMPDIPAPPAPTPETPPSPMAGVRKTNKDNARRTGFKNNLFTGGAGLKSINQQNLVRKILGNKLGLSK